MTAQIVPAACLMLTSALNSPACPLTGTLPEVTTAGFFREAFIFTAVVTDLVLAMWIGFCMYESRQLANLRNHVQYASSMTSSPCGGSHSGQRL